MSSITFPTRLKCNIPRDKVCIFISITLFVAGLLTCYGLIQNQAFSFHEWNIITIGLSITAMSVLLLLSRVLYKTIKERAQENIELSNNTRTDPLANVTIPGELWDSKAKINENERISLENVVHALERDPCNENFAYILFAPNSGVWAARLNTSPIAANLDDCGNWYVATSLDPHLKAVSLAGCRQSETPVIFSKKRGQYPDPAWCYAAFYFNDSFRGPQAYALGNHIEKQVNVTRGRQFNSTITQISHPKGECEYYIDGERAILVNHRKIKTEAPIKKNLIDQYLQNEKLPKALIKIIIDEYLYS